MIPKVIHYCWFSGEKQNRFIRNCIRSWQKAMPDYVIKCWDQHSFDFESIPFVKEAYDEKKWAFVADYVRLYALYTEGGIYLDSDVKTFKPFDIFLNNEFFIGTEPLGDSYPPVELESAIMGAVKGFPYLKECMDYYKSIHFRNEKGDITITCPRVMTAVAQKYGYEAKDENQLLSNGMYVYSRKYFGHCFGTAPADYYAIHYFNASWLEIKHGKIYNFCKRNDLMSLYKFIEKMI